MKKHYDVFVRAFAVAMLATMSAGPSEPGAGGKIPLPPKLTYLLTLSQSGGGNDKLWPLHYYLPSPPDFQTFLRRP